MKRPRRLTRTILGTAVVLLMILAILSQPVLAVAGDGGRPKGEASKQSDELQAAVVDLLRTLSSFGTLDEESQEAPRLQRAEDGYLRFLGASPSKHFTVTEEKGVKPEAIARNFLEKHGMAFGISSTSADFEVLTVKQGEDRHFVRLQQTYSGIPIFAGEIIVETDTMGGVVSVLADILRDTWSLDSQRLSTVPVLSACDAMQAAIDAIQKENGAVQLQASEPTLLIYEPSVLGNTGPTILAWETIITSPDQWGVAENVLVDARTGEVAFQYSHVEYALGRHIDGESDHRGENDPEVKSEDVNAAWRNFGYSYNFYWAHHQRNSFNNGAILPGNPPLDFGQPIYAAVEVSSLQYDAGYDPDGEDFVFGDGMPVDDVVGHEYTHAVTCHESGLLPSGESGAIGEAFSDTWGEWIDLTYNDLYDDDGPNVKWLIAEDSDAAGHGGAGALRNMADPPAINAHTLYEKLGKDNDYPQGYPDSMDSPYWYTGSDVSGFIYINSTVGSKLAYLLSEDVGSSTTFRGFTVQGMGIDKVEDLFYDVQCNRLTSASDYTDLCFQLSQAAYAMGWSVTERQNLVDACMAVGIDMVYISPSSGVSAIQLPDTGLHVYSIASEGYLMETWYEPGDSMWHNAPIAAGMSPSSGVSALLLSSGGLRVYSIRSNGKLAETWWNPGQPTWQTCDLTTTVMITSSEVSALELDSGGLRVYSIKSNGDLSETWWDPGDPGWGNGTLASGMSTSGGVSALELDSGGLRVYSIKSNGGLSETWWDPGDPGWGNGTLASGMSMSGRVSALELDSGGLRVYSIKSNGGLSETWWDPGDPGWGNGTVP